MRCFFLIICFLFTASDAYAVATIFCKGVRPCAAVVQKKTVAEAQKDAMIRCNNLLVGDGNCLEMGLPFQWECRSVYSTSDGSWYEPGTDFRSAQENTKRDCNANGCTHTITVCDTQRDSGALYSEVNSTNPRTTDVAPQPAFNAYSFNQYYIAAALVGAFALLIACFFLGRWTCNSPFATERNRLPISTKTSI